MRQFPAVATTMLVLLLAVEGQGPPMAFSQDGPKKQVFGSLSTLDRSGKPGALNLSVDGVERSYLAGGTSSAAVWRFSGLKPEAFPDGIPVRISGKPMRTPYRALERRVVLVSLSVRNPKTGLRREAGIVGLTPVGECSFLIPLHPKAVVPNRTLDLFADFVEDESLEIEIRSLEPGVFIGVTERDVYLAPKWEGIQTAKAKPRSSGATPPDKLRQSEGDPYARAIAAAQSTWQQYDEAIFEFIDSREKRQGIFLEDELRIADQLDGDLRQCLGDLHLKLKESGDASNWFRAAIIHAMLGEEKEMLEPLEKAASLSAQYRGILHYCRAEQYYREADVSRARDEVKEAVRLNPKDMTALQLLKQIAQQLDEPLSKEQQEALKGTASQPRRTLPWSTIYPFDASVRALAKPIPTDALAP